MSRVDERWSGVAQVIYKYNGYPIFGDVVMNSIKLEELAGLINQKK
jgi:hypothetical protein